MFNDEKQLCCCNSYKHIIGCTNYFWTFVNFENEQKLYFIVSHFIGRLPENGPCTAGFTPVSFTFFYVIIIFDW